MGTTVIDQLIVQLGLDPKNFNKGQKDAVKQLKGFEAETKKSSDYIEKNLTRAATSIAGMFLSFEGAKRLIGILADINTEVANLGRFSRNVGQSSHEVNLWGQAVELVGGKASAAQSAFMQLSQDITRLKMTAEVSPLLLLFQRMQVSLWNTDGTVRNTTQLYQDLADKLSKYDHVQAFNMASQAGLETDFLNLLLLEKKDRDALLRTAEESNRITEEETKKAQALQAAWASVGQEFKNVGRAIDEKLSPSLIAASRFLADWLNRHFGNSPISLMSMMWRGVGAAEFPSTGQNRGVINRNPGPYGAQFAATEQKYGLPPGLLARVAKAESNNNPNAVSSRGAVGLMQLMPKFFPGAGKDINSDIDRSGKYLAELIARYGDVNLALQAYNVGPQALDRILAGQRGMPAETAAYPGRVFGPNPSALSAAQGALPTPLLSGAGGGNQTSSVNNETHIGEINVNTAATDAPGIAGGIGSAIARKNLAAQSDTGMQ